MSYHYEEIYKDGQATGKYQVLWSVPGMEYCNDLSFDSKEEAGDRVHYLNGGNSTMKHIAELEADCETSINHNAGVIDRIIDQLRDAGYTGTLSNMIDAVLSNLVDLEANAQKREAYIAKLQDGK